MLVWENVKFLSTHRVSMFFPRTKVKDNVTVQCHRTGVGLCAVDSLSKLKEVADLLGRGYPTDPVFTEDNGIDPLAYVSGVRIIKQEIEKIMIPAERGLVNVNGYSLRRGAATTGYLMQLPIKLVKSITRHSSNAVLNYISSDASAAKDWQLNVANLNPQLSWFGCIKKDVAARLAVSNLDEWESRVPRLGIEWK